MNSDRNTSSRPAELLNDARVKIAPETFTLISLRPEEFARLVQDSKLSPGGSAPFMILSDRREVTLMLDQTDFHMLEHAVRRAKIEAGFRLLTFELEMDFAVVGFLAEVARILAAADIPILAVSAFSRDHLLIKQEHLASALKILGEHVSDLC